jgi:PAS domain S-box-containing protein
MTKDGQPLKKTDASQNTAQAEEHFRLLLESLPTGLIMTTADGVLSFVNSQIEEQFGYERADLIGKPIEVLIPMRHRSSHAVDRQSYATKPERRSMGIGRDLFGLHLDGTEFPVEVGLTPIETSDGTAILCSVIDITERKSAEAEKDQLLRELDQRKDEMTCLYHIGEEFRSLGLDDHVFQNVAGFLQEGLSSEMAIGVRITFDGKSYTSANFSETGETVSTPITIEGTRRGSIDVYLSASLKQTRVDAWFRTKKQLIETVSNLIGDCVGRMDAEAKVVQSAKLASVGELAAGVGHEINNPINGIINCADILIQDLKDDSKSHEFASLIRSEAQRIAGIVSSLLAFSRRDEGMYSLANVGDIVSGVLDLCGKRVEKAGIQLDVDIPEELPKISCRSEQLQQVVMNLTINAIHALEARYPSAHPEKRMRISANALNTDPGQIRIAIEDFGTGIPKEHLHRIFDPFFTTKGRDIGTGLGLSISDGIVRSHGGALTVETEPGEFTRFHVDLPLPTNGDANLGVKKESGEVTA